MIPISWIPSGKLTVCYLKNRQVNYFYVPFSSIFNGYVELPEDLHGAPNHPFGNSFYNLWWWLGEGADGIVLPTKKNHCFTGSSMKIHIFLWVFHWHPAIGAPLTHENSMCFSGGFSPSTASGFPKHPPLFFGSYWDYADRTNDVQRGKTMGTWWFNGDLSMINPWLMVINGHLPSGYD